MAKPDEIKIGDIVRLNSGGPKMTVAYIPSFLPALGADVVWINKGTKNYASYPVVCLTKVSA